VPQSYWNLKRWRSLYVSLDTAAVSQNSFELEIGFVSIQNAIVAIMNTPSSAETVAPSSPISDLAGPGFFNSPDQSTSYSGRLKFACCDDVLLLREVNSLKPWETAYGKIMAIWNQIASNLKTNPSFIQNRKGPALKTRFDLLLKRSRRMSSSL
jgi:hypothetical protein